MYKLCDHSFLQKRKSIKIYAKVGRIPKIKCAEDNDFGKRWLGNMLLYLGVKLEKAKCQYRGYLNYYEHTDKREVTLQVISAYYPQLGQCTF